MGTGKLQIKLTYSLLMSKSIKWCWCYEHWKVLFHQLQYYKLCTWRRKRKNSFSVFLRELSALIPCRKSSGTPLGSIMSETVTSAGFNQDAKGIFSPIICHIHLSFTFSEGKCIKRLQHVTPFVSNSKYNLMVLSKYTTNKMFHLAKGLVSWAFYLHLRRQLFWYWRCNT